MNIEVHISLQITGFVFFRQIPGSGIAGNSILNFLRNLHTVFRSGYTNLQYNHQFMRVLFSPYPIQHLLFLVFLIIATLTSERSHIIVVLICISLIISDVEHSFMCLLATCMSSLQKCLFRSSAHFLIWLFVFILLSCMSSLYILNINPYWIYDLQISSPIQ